MKILWKENYNSEDKSKNVKCLMLCVAILMFLISYMMSPLATDIKHSKN